MAENRREATISNPLPTPHLQELATSMTTVAGNAKQIDLLILGGGRGGKAMLEVLQHYDWVNIHAIVDITEQALAFPMARETGIATFIDRDKAFQQFHGDIVIDVTGDKSMPKLLAPGLRLRQIELISGKSAKMLFDLIHEQLRKDQTIGRQNTRMNLLDSMLEITMQLENRPPLTDIINKAVEDLCHHVRAPHALAAIFNRDGSGTIIRAVGVEKPDCELSDCIVIQAICAELNEHDFKQVNDGYGHQVGDMVITEIAQAILKSVRDYDTCARYGGDEFVLLMPESASDADFHMEKIGMRILEHVDAISISEAPELSIGVSIGMARKSAETLVDGTKLLAMADHPVYQAKEAGKNCMRICSDEQFHLSSDSA